MVSLRIAAWSYVGLVALAAAIGGEVWGLRVHTLHASGRWHSAKLDLARPVMGAVGFVAPGDPQQGDRDQRVDQAEGEVIDQTRRCLAMRTPGALPGGLAAGG